MTTIIPEKDLGLGLDAFHPATKLADGFVPYIRNFDPSYDSTLTRRTGYERVGGYMPVRVERVQRSGTTLTFTFSSELSTTDLPIGPVAIYARLVRYSSNGVGTDRIGDITTKTQTLNYSTFTKVSANQISVVGSNSTGATDTYQTGSLTNSAALVGVDSWIWGLKLDTMVTDTDADRRSWVTALDSYVTKSRSTLVASFLGNIYSLADQASYGTLYGMPSPTLNLSHTVNSTVVIGPAFFGTVPALPPTRGYVVVPSSGNLGNLEVISSSYDVGTGYTTYNLDATGATVSGALSSIFRANLDYLTVQDSTWASLDGDHLIVQTPTLNAGILTVVTLNTANQELDQQHADIGTTGSRAAVLTDRIPVTGLPRFLSGDILQPENVGLSVVSDISNALIVKYVAEPQTVASATILTVERTASCLPVSSTAGLVRGDMLSVTGYAQRVRIVNVNSGADFAATVSATGAVATLNAVGASFLSIYSVGDKISLLNAGVLTGDQTISAVNSNTQLEFESALVVGTTSCTLVGSNIGLDESLTLTSGAVLSVIERWAVASAPDVPQKRIDPALNRRYGLPAGGTTDASLPAATELADSSYMTNYFDPVQKFDGTASHRAGLNRWNPLVGFDVHSNSPSLIQNPYPRIDPVAIDAAGSTITVSTNLDRVGSYAPGDQIVVVAAPLGIEATDLRSEVATISSINIGATTASISLSTRLKTFGDFDTTDSSIYVYKALRFRYYYRYVAKDSNGRVVASAASGSQDNVVVIGPPAVITQKLALYPAFDSQEFDSIDLEIYRTDDTGAPPFRKIGIIPVKYSYDQPFGSGFTPLAFNRSYELFEDSNQIGVGSGSTDLLTDALTGGASVGADWEEPPRATCAETVNGRLILGNIRSWPEQSLALRESPTQAPSAFTMSLAHNTKVVYRRDGATTSITDLRTTQTYELLRMESLADPQIEYAVTVGQAGSPVNQFTVTVPTGSIPAGLAIGSWFFLGKPRARTQQAYGGLDFCGWYQLVTAPAVVGGGYNFSFIMPARTTFTITSADTATDILTTSAPHGLTTGSPIVFLQGAPTGLAPLAANVQYYAAVLSPTTFKISFSAYGAYHGLFVNITTTGTGIMSLQYAYPETLYKQPEDETFTLVFASNYIDIPVPLYDTAPSQVLVASTDAATDVITTSAPHTLVTGTAVRAANLVTAGAPEDYTFFAVVTGATTLKLSDTFQHSIAGTGIQDLSATSGVGTIVPLGLEFTGFYRTSELLNETSVQLQDAVNRLARAINSVHAASTEFLNFTSSSTTVGEQNWLSADSGADYPFGVLYTRRPEADGYTIEIQNTIDSQGRDKLLFFAGDTRVPNLGIRADSAVISTTDNIVFKVDHGLSTGTPVRLQTTGGLPAPLVAGTRYFAIRVSDTQFGLATTLADALTDTRIDLTTVGTGTHQLSAELSSTQRVFGSRLVRSYPNYPEIFAGPYAPSDLFGDSIIDVNPDDGQEIRQIINFFGDSYSKASQQESRLVVFKDRDVYMVNTETREVQQIETMGHGAGFWRSVCTTQDGIMYADRDGIYKINRQAQWVYLGQPLGRTWTKETAAATAEPDIPVGHHDTRDNRAMLSIPSQGEAVSTLQLVYDHTREKGGAPGSWTVYDNFKPVCWTEHLGTTYHGTRSGLVMAERQTGTNSDYRDDNTDYTSTVRFRVTDLGALGKRKQVPWVVMEYESLGEMSVTGIEVSASIDNSNVFIPCDDTRLLFQPADTGTGDIEQPSIYSLSYSIPLRKADYFQMRVSVSGLGTPLKLTQYAYHVELLDHKGVQQAGPTAR